MEMKKNIMKIRDVFIHQIKEKVDKIKQIRACRLNTESIISNYWMINTFENICIGDINEGLSIVYIII